MGRLVFILFLLNLYAGSPAFSAPADSMMQRIRELSGKYINYYCSNTNDSVFVLCAEAEKQADIQKNYFAKLQAGQLLVNAFCQKGYIDEGIDTAKRMYEEAKKQNHNLGLALATQAIGATYMYSGQYRDADTTFLEAERLMHGENDPLSQLRLSIQQLHTCMNLDDTSRMAFYLLKAEKLVTELPKTEQPDYLFYIECYKTIYQLRMNTLNRARRGLEAVLHSKPENGSFSRWLYYVQSQYYKQTGDFGKALVYSDSTLQQIQRAGNMNEFKNSLTEKAILLEKTEQYKEASDIYEQINNLTDSLNNSQYAEQINALHLTYWVDQIAIDNVAAHNRLLAFAILSAVICSLFAGGLIVFSKRKNRQLILSREKLEAARETAADSIHSKSLFLSNMSHELRTPLNAIVGFSGILTGMDEIDAETKQLCGDSIKQNSELLMRLINDIVDFSELKGDKIKFTIEKCEVVSLCSNIINTVKNIKQTQAELFFDTSLKTLEFYTDKGRLQQVLINLLVNATKFTKEGTITLNLTVNEKKDAAVFTVEDTGCGIPLEKQPQIFERFEKLHENIQGTGLGLSICQLIVEQMGGRIWIDPEYTQGARFVFTHPLHNKTQEQPT